jgi:beta-phosphoglucomutase-like phosphatase (HAD superfamily)
VVVEDAGVGVQAGRAAGMHTIGITGTDPPRRLDADVVIASMADLPPGTFDRLVPAV